MIEDELRATFARHEQDAPDLTAIRGRIDVLARQRRRIRSVLRLAAVSVVAALAISAVPLLRDQFTGAAPLLPAVPSPSRLPALPPTPINLLLLGLDGPFRDDGPPQPPTMINQRSDSITLVHIPADRSKVYLISLPRDAGVEIPGRGWDRMNAAYSFGGLSLAGETVRRLTGVRLDGTAAIQLDTVARMADVIGPIPVCMPHQVTSIHTGRVFPVGCQQIDGAATADLLRQRKGQPLGSLDRDRTAQRVLLGLASRFSELNLLTDSSKIMNLLSAGGAGLQLDTNGQGQTWLAQLAWELRDIDAEDVSGFGQPKHTPLMKGNLGLSELAPESPELFAAIRDGTLDQFAKSHPDWLLQR